MKKLIRKLAAKLNMKKFADDTNNEFISVENLPSNLTNALEETEQQRKTNEERGWQSFPYNLVDESERFRMQTAELPEGITPEMLEKVNYHHPENTISWADYKNTEGQNAWTLGDIQSDIMQRSRELSTDYREIVANNVNSMSKKINKLLRAGKTAEAQQVLLNAIKSSPPPEKSGKLEQSQGTKAEEYYNKLLAALANPLNEAQISRFIAAVNGVAENMSEAEKARSFPMGTRSKIENYFKDWDKELIYRVIQNAKAQGKDAVYVPTSETVAQRWGHEPGRLGLFQRIYDQNIAAYSPTKVNIKGKTYWKIDTKNLTEAAIHRGYRRSILAGRMQYAVDLEQWKHIAQVYIQKFMEVLNEQNPPTEEEIPGIKNTEKSQRLLQAWEMLLQDPDTLPTEIKENPAALEAIKQYLREIGYNIPEGNVPKGTPTTPEIDEGPVKPTSVVPQMTAAEAKFLNNHTTDDIWNLVRDNATINTPEGQIARKLIEKGIVASRLNMKKIAVDYETGSIQTSDVSKKVIEQIKNIQKGIDKDDLSDLADEPGWVEHGIQKLFHITVLFGTDDDIVDEIKKVFDKYGPVEVSTDKIDYFTENPQYDVAIVRCKSKGLTKIHNELKKELKNKDSHPKYNPHITIAYLKKGKKLDKDVSIKDISWKINSLELSTSKGKLEKIATMAIPIRTSLDYPHSWNKKAAIQLTQKGLLLYEQLLDNPDMQLPPGYENVKALVTALDWVEQNSDATINELSRRWQEYSNYQSGLIGNDVGKEERTYFDSQVQPVLQQLIEDGYVTQTPTEKTASTKKSNILDAPRATLDPAIWERGKDDLPMLKPAVKIKIIKNFFGYISKFGGYIKPEEWVKNMFYTGSTATYTYNDTSDIDIHIIVDWIDLAKLNPDKVKKDPLEMWKDLQDTFWWTLNKISLPGTKHPLTYFVVRPGEEKKLIEAQEEMYDMGHDVWLIPPAKQVIALPEEAMSIAVEEASEIMSRIEEHLANAKKGVMEYDMLTILEKLSKENAPLVLLKLRDTQKAIDKELDALKDEYALLKKKRQEAFEQGKPIAPTNSKNYTLGNIIFKLVERYKLMNVLREIKRITDSKPLETDQIDEVSDALGFGE